MAASAREPACAVAGAPQQRDRLHIAAPRSSRNGAEQDKSALQVDQSAYWKDSKMARTSLNGYVWPS